MKMFGCNDIKTILIIFRHFIHGSFHVLVSPAFLSVLKPVLAIHILLTNHYSVYVKPLYVNQRYYFTFHTECIFSFCLYFFHVLLLCCKISNPLIFQLKLLFSLLFSLINISKNESNILLVSASKSKSLICDI